ncbi:MAG TPA: alcohol dehydrogenase catalytic domain-containing protein [Acidimicrobiia bacterium]|nr:alcohol dehydrogenase catalytic domain-containing protein [Acidimicrobiia bacterium]
MRAIRVDGPGKVSLAELPVPTPSPGEVLIRVAVSGICATDHKLAARGLETPRVLGHEIAGRLEDQTPVGVHPDIGCGRCEFCRAGFENRCARRVSIGIDRDGGLAEYVTVPERHVVPLGSLGLREGPLLEPLGCCLHAIEALEVGPDEPALVVGAGTMGLLALLALRSRGARVAVSQRSLLRRHLASELGADGVIGPGEDPGPVLGEPPTVVIVTAPTSQALSYALEIAAIGGRVHAFAGMPGGGEIDANVIHYRHLALTGSTGSRLADYHQALELAGSGKIDLSRFPTQLVTLEEAREVVAGERGLDASKVMIDLEKGV